MPPSPHFPGSIRRFIEEGRGDHGVEGAWRNINESQKLQIFHIVHQLTIILVLLLAELVNDPDQRHTDLCIDEGEELIVDGRELFHCFENI
jgi:hypothetical protein